MNGEHCKFPLCKRGAEKNGFCIGHRIYAGATIPEEKKTVIKPRSKKMVDNMKLYKERLKAFFSKAENFNCAIKAEGCTKFATCVHHTAGRTGPQLLNEADWVPSCSNCNLHVEINDGEARDKGFKKTRLGKVKKG